MPDLPPVTPYRSVSGRRRLPIIAVLLLCLLLIGSALYKAVEVASDDGMSDDGLSPALTHRLPPPAADPLAFTTTDPGQLRDVSPERAEAINAAIPIAMGENPAAAELRIGSDDPGSFLRALDCMTDAIYYEAANEPVDGQRAVAQVILNRVRHPSYPHNICGVVYQGAERRTGCQFTFTCDGSLLRAPMPGLRARARAVAMAAMGGFVFAPVGWATHYHADYVTPYWATTLMKSAVIGRHIFYRLSAAPTLSRLFSARYAGGEGAVPLVALTVADIGVEGDAGATAPAVPVAMGERPVLSPQGAAITDRAAIAPPPTALPGAIRPLSAPAPGAIGAAPALPAGQRWILTSGGDKAPSQPR